MTRGSTYYFLAVWMGTNILVGIAMGFLKGVYQIASVLAIRTILFLFFAVVRPLSHRKMHFFCFRLNPNLFKAVFEGLQAIVLALALYPTTKCGTFPPAVEISMLVLGFVIAITPPAMLLYELVAILVVYLRRKVCGHKIQRLKFDGGRGMLALGLKNNGGLKRQESVAIKPTSNNPELDKGFNTRHLKVKLQSLYRSNSLFTSISKSNIVTPDASDSTTNAHQDTSDIRSTSLLDISPEEENEIGTFLVTAQ